MMAALLLLEEKVPGTVSTRPLKGREKQNFGIAEAMP